MANKPIRTLLIDDHLFFRQGVIACLQQCPDIEVCGEAGDPDEGIAAVERLKPDVVVVDLTLGDRSGLEVVAELTANHPSIGVMVLSMHDESLYAHRCLRAGAKGYLMKDRGPNELEAAIRAVNDGQLHVSPEVTQQMLVEAVAPNPSGGDELGELTNREREVFELFGTGKTSKEVAEILGISYKTIDVHRVRIRKKLNHRSNADLMHHAVRWVESQSLVKMA